VQAEIRRALGRCPDLVLWRNSTGALTDAQGRVVRFGLCVGSADLIGCLAPGGRLIALEVKRPGGKPRPEQERFLELVRKMGGFGAVVTSPLEAIEAVERARRGEGQ
jgi:hypothetical protein